MRYPSFSQSQALPKESWWTCPAPEFSARCEQEQGRMRVSPFGQLQRASFGPDDQRVMPKTQERE